MHTPIFFIKFIIKNTNDMKVDISLNYILHISGLSKDLNIHNDKLVVWCCRIHRLHLFKGVMTH